MSVGIDRAEALTRYHAASGERPLPAATLTDRELLQRFHPDHDEAAMVYLQTGPNRGERCHRALAQLLQADALLDDADLAGAPVTETDVLVVGGGGAGCAAALEAASQGAQVILATKLRLGDSNTVMAEGGIQASVDKPDTPGLHYRDTLAGGHGCADPALVAQLVQDGPEVIRWLIRQGMQFDQSPYGDLLTRRAGGTSEARVLYHRDYTGHEMMKVLREEVRNSPVAVWDYCPVVELLTGDGGDCAGAVVYSLDRRRYELVRARAVILTTGGIGRLHLSDFPTSNHFGATGDGLVLAYRAGARLREIDSFQYHPTGMAHPRFVEGKLVTEGARSSGAYLLNGLGERFVDELKPRDVVTAAILRECREGRGVTVAGAVKGVWLDTPGLERRHPGILAERFPKLLQLRSGHGIDPATEPLLIHPTLHYQNGGVAIDIHGATGVPGLYCAGEVSGGIHGRNRLMGNALLEIIGYGRRAGAHAAAQSRGRALAAVTVEHVRQLRRELSRAGLPLTGKGPQLFPGYANFTGPWAAAAEGGHD